MADEWLRVLGEKLGLKGLDMAIDVTRLTDPQQVQALSPNASNHGYPLPTPFSKPTSIKHHLTSSWMYGHTCQSHTHTETQFTIQHSSLFCFLGKGTCNIISPQDKRLRRHFGGNIHILRSVAAMKVFENIIDDVVSKLQQKASEMLQHGDFLVNCVVFCKSGRHRSVAAAYCLQHILNQPGSPFSASIVHVERDQWVHLCTQCRDCQTGDGHRSFFEALARRWPLPQS